MTANESVPRTFAIVILLAGCGSRTQLSEVQASIPTSNVSTTCGGEGLTTLFAGDNSGSYSILDGIVVDATRVYWLSSEENDQPASIQSIPKCGGAAATLVTGLRHPVGLVADDDFLYWSDPGGYDSNLGVIVPGTISRVSKGGGATTILASSSQGTNAGWDPGPLATDDINVYSAAALVGEIAEVPNGGSALQIFAAKQYLPDPYDPTGAPEGPNTIAVDTTNVYWTIAATVFRAPKAGGPPITLTDGNALDNDYDLAVDDTNVYWLEENGSGVGSLSKAPKTGGPPVALVTNIAAQAIAFDDTNVYWTDPGPLDPSGGFSGPGAIMSVPKSGGASVSLAGGQRSSVGGIAVDADAVYWLNGRDVMRVPK